MKRPKRLLRIPNKTQTGHDFRPLFDPDMPTDVIKMAPFGKAAIIAASRQMEAQDRERQMPLSVPRKVESIVETRFLPRSLRANKAPMLRCMFLDRTERGGDFAIIDEVQNGSFGVTPGQVAKELVDCCQVLLSPAPELAFRNKDVVLVVAHQNISLAGFIEGLAGRGYLSELPFQLHKEFVAEGLFVLPLIRTGKALPRASMVVKDAQNLLIHSCVEHPLLPKR